MKKNNKTNKINLTEEAKANKAAANKAWAVRRKEALTVILDFMKEHKDELNDEQLKAVNVYSGNRTSSTRGVKYDLLAQIRENGSIHEDDIFKEHKLGRTDVRTLFNTFIKTKPEERIWIALDKETGLYTIAAEQPEVPKGWTGYIPSDMQTVDESETVDEDSLTEESDDDFETLEA